LRSTLRQNGASGNTLQRTFSDSAAAFPPSRVQKAKRRPSQVEAALCKASFSIDFKPACQSGRGWINPPRPSSLTAYNQ
jgi:hypothetical protein